VEAIPIAMMMVGALLLFVGWLWVVVQAFGENPLWGLGSLFVGLVWLIFAAINWHKTRRPVGYFALGLLCMVGSVAAAALIGGPEAATNG
jgi:hypothetical protein